MAAGNMVDLMDIIEQMRLVAWAAINGPTPTSCADLGISELGLPQPERIQRGEDGGIILQLGERPGNTIVVATPNGQPPFTVGWT